MEPAMDDSSHKEYEASAEEFLSCFTPLWPSRVKSREEQRLHLQDLVTSKLLNMLRKPTNDPAELSKPLIVADMSFQAKSIYRIMVNTFAPRRGRHREPKGVMHNLLVSILGYMKFDTEDFFMRTMLLAVQEPLTQKPYTPWLMDFLVKKTQRPFRATTIHGSYLPDVETATPTPAPIPMAPAQGTNERGKYVPADISTSSSIPPASTRPTETNANLAGQLIHLQRIYNL